LPCEPSSVTVIQDSAGRYFLSFVVVIEASPLEPISQSVGIDLGVSTFATLSTGEKIDAPKPLKRRINRLRKLDKQLSNKSKGSNRYEKARRRRAKLHSKLADTRTDFLHKLSTRLISENQTIVLEDLNVSGMVRNRRLCRAISDLGWRQFRTLCEGKAEKYGREFRIVNRWEPTSQKCSCCGFKGGKLDLSVREWKCANCGTYHDRDINAAKNIVAGGQSETQGALSDAEPSSARVAPQNGRGDRVRLSQKGAMVDETSTRQNLSVNAGR
jgi:putative transposase